MTEAADFADFVQRRSGALLRAAWLLTSGDWALAEDLAQTALGEVWRHWDRVAAMDAPDAYAHKVLVNTSLRWRGDAGPERRHLPSCRIARPPAADTSR